MESAEPGPIVWLTSCGHGDEVGGVVIIQEIFRRIKGRLAKGQVHAFPLMNPIGFETTSRNITLSREDLNRSFPGSPAGSLGERLAHLVFSKILETSPDLVLDLHNDWVKSIPYVVLDMQITGRTSETFDRTVEFARETGFCMIREVDEVPGTLTHNLLLREIPALTLELGEPYVVNEENIGFGVGAIMNILSHLGMIGEAVERFSYPLPEPHVKGKVLGYSDKPYSSKSGIVRFIAHPGDIVKKGQTIARIVNAFGKLVETVKAVDDAIVLGHSDSSVVFPGMHIMAFGVL
jgi:predicted deacylase